MGKKLYKEIIMPQVGVNEDSGILEEWLCDDGSKVTKGQPLCCFETTKTIIEVESDYDGYLVQLFNRGDRVAINTTIGLVVKNDSDLKTIENDFKNKKLKDEKSISSSKITNKAMELIIDMGLDPEDFPKNKIIRSSDVYDIIDNSKKKKDSNNISFSVTSKSILIYGSGNGANTVYDIFKMKNQNDVVCFIDDNKSHPASLSDLPVLHSSNLKKLYKKGLRLIALGMSGGKVRVRLKNKLIKMGFEVINVIHPSSFISYSVKLGIGNFIKAGAIIETNSTIGDCCIIDNNVTIPHDNVIGDGVHIAPGVAMGSSIIIGNSAIIGIGASLSTGIEVGKNCIISVGTSVTESIPNNSIIEGVPGKIVGKAR